ncbi:MAG TPA: PilZ domain-containing protein [Candidatus Dormibacteraeota bacterium]|nr:PilZ domain-containing protein [Candidatus Dormibacteraeota bacterium]
MGLKLIREKEGERLQPAERRRSPRIRLQIPIFLRGVDSAGGEFLELTKTLDISSTGAFIACTRHFAEGQMVSLTIPAPSPATSSSVPPETPPIAARVKRQQTTADIYLIGLEFLKSLD